jgi:hypothetical protein
MTSEVTWCIERGIFPDTQDEMVDAIRSLGQKVIFWRENLRGLESEKVVFHGSLGIANDLASRVIWKPGAFCNTKGFECTSWYARAEPWLLNNLWTLTTVNGLVKDPTKVLDIVGAVGHAFVRPNSPLKPFSGRVLKQEDISFRSLDLGFYYDDFTLPVIVAPVRVIDREWRYVVVDGVVISGSAYDAEQRRAIPEDMTIRTRFFAEEIARELTPPEDVYVMDICESDGDLYLLELNPFSGADLYACDRKKVVAAVSRKVASMV